MQSFVKRAEAAGCEALVVTLDTTMLGWRIPDLELAYLPFLRGMGIAQYTRDPVFQQLIDQPDDEPTPKPDLTLAAIGTLLQMVRHYPGRGFWQKLRSGRRAQRCAASSRFTRGHRSAGQTSRPCAK